MSEWKPIETVPKDGRFILVCCMSPSQETIKEPGYMAVDCFDSSYTSGFGKFNCLHFPPTHWMPLPAPPEEGRD